MLTLPVYIFLPAFYTQAVGVPIATVGAILLLTRVADAISDPLIGYTCDRLSTGYGRRKFWLILGTPIAMLSAYMLFVPPEGAGATHLLVWSLALSLAWTVMLIPYGAWGAELTGDYDDRNRVAGVRESFTVIGTLLASATPALLPAFGYAAKADSMMAIALLVVVLLPVAIAIACLFAPEPGELSTRRTSFREGLRLLSTNIAFLRLLSAYLANGVANALPATLFPVLRQLSPWQPGVLWPDAVRLLPVRGDRDPGLAGPRPSHQQEGRLDGCHAHRLRGVPYRAAARARRCCSVLGYRRHLPACASGPICRYHRRCRRMWST